MATRALSIATLTLITTTTTAARAQPAPAPTAPLAVEPTSAPPATEATAPPTSADPATVAAAPAAPPAVDPALIAAIVDERLAERERITYKDGFALQTARGDFKLKVGGYSHFDGRWFASDDADRNPDQFTFRRIRVDLTGTLLDRAEFRLLPDFAGGKTVVQDAYVELAVAAPLKLRFGKFKEPFGLERLQSATALTFVERGLPTTLVPNRDLGVQLGGEVASKRVSYQLGVFDGVADGGSTDGDVADSKEVAARVFVTPFASSKGHALEQLGVGGAVTYGDQHGTTAATDLPTLRTAGQAAFFQYRAGTTAADTAIADGRHWRITGQGHYYRGPVGVLAEYVHSAQRVALGTAATEVASDAWQVAINVVAIGGSAGWKGSTTKASFAPDDGHWGALELAARYNELRVSDHAFTFAADSAKSARRARAVAVGASWILGRALRFVADYERTSFAGGAADGAARPTEHAILGRVQTVF